MADMAQHTNAASAREGHRAVDTADSSAQLENTYIETPQEYGKVGRSAAVAKVCATTHPMLIRTLYFDKAGSKPSCNPC